MSDALPDAVRILVVDDDEAICRQLAGGLSSAGFHVVTATDGSGAIQQATVTPPDVALVDLEMGPTGGLDVIRHLKRIHGAAVHVIVLTGHDDERSRAGAFDAGTDDFIVKPIGIAEIRRRIIAALRTQRELIQTRVDKEAAERRLVYGQEASALLAHDLNNGLSVALGNLTFLREIMVGDAEVGDALAATLRSVRRMAGLVANFVDIARFEDAAVKPRVGRTSVWQLLSSIIAVHSPSITRGIRIEVDCDEGLTGVFDPGLIERVLHNMFGNASRYCVEGGRIILRGRRLYDNADGSVELSVTNTGAQVPDEIRDTLFNKYVRGKGGRRGMGLYFCRLVAEAHGGSIACEQHELGPCFAIRLPGHA